MTLNYISAKSNATYIAAQNVNLLSVLWFLV